MTFLLFPRLDLAALRWTMALLLACGLLFGREATAACNVVGACISAGPRLATVDTTKSALLNPLLDGLLGTNLNLTAVD